MMELLGGVHPCFFFRMLFPSFFPLMMSLLDFHMPTPFFPASCFICFDANVFDVFLAHSSPTMPELAYKCTGHLHD